MYTSYHILLRRNAHIHHGGLEVSQGLPAAELPRLRNRRVRHVEILQEDLKTKQRGEMMMMKAERAGRCRRHGGRHDLPARRTPPTKGHSLILPLLERMQIVRKMFRRGMLMLLGLGPAACRQMESPRRGRRRRSSGYLKGRGGWQARLGSTDKIESLRAMGPRDEHLEKRRAAAKERVPVLLLLLLLLLPSANPAV